MGIGDKVRAAEEAKAEAAMNAEGRLSGRQLKELVGRGLSVGDARALAADGLSYDDILEVANAAVQPAPQGNLGEALSPMFDKVLERARNRRPESYNGDFPFPNISSRNPDGDADPVPPFKCEFFEGQWYRDEREHRDKWIVEKPGIEHGQLSKREVKLLNQLEPGEYHVENYDGELGLVRVTATTNDATGALQQLTIFYPRHWTDRASKGRKKPVLEKLLADILQIGSHRADAIEEWLREREAVAA